MKKSVVTALIALTAFIGASTAQAQAQEPEPSTVDAIIAQEHGRALDLLRTAPNQTAGQPVEPQWMQALEARSQELNRKHGLGEYAPAIRALKLRSEALNRQHGLGSYSGTVTTTGNEIEWSQIGIGVGVGDRAEPSTIDRIIAQERGRALDFGLAERPVLVVAAADDGFDWTDAGVGGAAVLALALLAMAGLALRSGTRQRTA